jgi:hypothetical protein
MGHLRRLRAEDVGLPGRVNVRHNEKRRTYRLRFTSVHEDQAESIFQALNEARKEASTDYDVVALEWICLGYLAQSKSRIARKF